MSLAVVKRSVALAVAFETDFVQFLGDGVIELAGRAWIVADNLLQDVGLFVVGTAGGRSSISYRTTPRLKMSEQPSTRYLRHWPVRDSCRLECP